MEEEDKLAYVSGHARFCQGASDTDRYLVALNVASAKTKRRFTHEGSDMLDRINAFDLAESARVRMGQINLIEVSSFCGPQGLLWGRDLAAHPGLRERRLLTIRRQDGGEVPVYDGGPLIDASRALFGTLDEPRFPLAPGTHCRTASKSVTHVGEGVIYGACAVGISDEGTETASIFMEDVGVVRPEASGDMEGVEESVRRAAAESVLAVAANQRIPCGEIFVSFVHERLAEDEVGCCVTLVPYFRIAKDAAPDGIDPLRETTLDAWRRRCAP